MEYPNEESSSVAENKLKRWHLAVGAVTALIAFLIIRALVGPDPAVVRGTPEEIQGTWTTTDERYAGRAFEIREDEFWLHLGPDSVMPYRISEIRRYDRADHGEYEVTYHTREEATTQVFRLFPDGTVRLNNPSDVVWTRR